MFHSDINLVKSLSSPSNDYDALIIIATELDQIKEYVHHSVSKDLHTFQQVKRLIIFFFVILIFLF